MASVQRNDLLQKVDRSILQAGILLEQFPFYEYADGDEWNVVFIGGFDALYPYVSMVAATAQALDRTLKLHIVSDETAFRNGLLKSAPLLEKYSNLGDGAEESYVEFHFHSSIGETKSIEHRYAIAASDRVSEIQSALKALIKLYSAAPEKKAVIHYACLDALDVEAPRHITLNHPDMGQQRKFADRLGEMAFRLHYLYTKESDPHCNYEQCREAFRNDGYSQTSSLASVLHCKYKLFSIGINPRSARGSIIKAYDRIVCRGDKSVWNSLVYLEHRRWMLYTIFAGYSCPTLEQIDRYAYINGNNRWRSDKLRLHNCLVPCGRNTGFALQELTHEVWDVPIEAIDTLDLDPLDQMSLRIHALAKKKMALAQVAVESELRTLQTLLSAVGAPAESTACLELFRDRISGLMLGKNLQFIDVFFEDIRRTFTAHAVPGESNLLTIRSHLKIVEEYYSCHDFKLADRLIVDDLLYILYVNRVSLIKLVSDRVLDNITVPLILEPENLVYVGLDRVRADEYRAFFQARGNNTAVSAHAIAKSDAAGIRKRLERIINIQTSLRR